MDLKVKITKRELEVLRLTANGLTIKEIASSLNISKSTVMSHQLNLKTKLGCKNSQELTYKAAKLNLI